MFQKMLHINGVCVAEPVALFSVVETRSTNIHCIVCCDTVNSQVMWSGRTNLDVSA